LCFEPGGRALLALGGAVLLVPCLAGARTDSAPLRPRCEIALAYAQEVIARYSGPLIFDGERPALIDILGSGWWREGADPPVRVAPPHALLDGLQGRGMSLPSGIARPCAGSSPPAALHMVGASSGISAARRGGCVTRRESWVSRFPC
jgi:hypothetical protein